MPYTKSQPLSTRWCNCHCQTIVSWKFWIISYCIDRLCHPVWKVCSFGSSKKIWHENQYSFLKIVRIVIFGFLWGCHEVRKQCKLHLHCYYFNEVDLRMYKHSGWVTRYCCSKNDNACNMRSGKGPKSGRTVGAGTQVNRFPSPRHKPYYRKCLRRCKHLWALVIVARIHYDVWVLHNMEQPDMLSILENVQHKSSFLSWRLIYKITRLIGWIEGKLSTTVHWFLTIPNEPPSHEKCTHGEVVNWVEVCWLVLPSENESE